LLTFSFIEASLQNLKRKNLRSGSIFVFIFDILLLSALSVSIRFGNDQAASPSTPVESVRFRLAAWSTESTHWYPIRELLKKRDFQLNCFYFLVCNAKSMQNAMQTSLINYLFFYRHIDFHTQHNIH